MAKTRTRSSFRPKLISLAVASCFMAGTALANPTGPAVVHGTAAIHRAGNLLQITNSPNAIINWQSFSIGASEITRFIQQSQASAVLNRVTGAGGRIDPSVILGTLQSNGRVFLINPNGILFGAGAQVDVAGLMASSLNLSNADFLAGRLRFTEVPGAGAVINQGSITTGAGGSVYLVGSAVTNSGIITSPQGEVVLAAGNTVELVNPGTPNLRVEIAAADNEARNLGQIMSDAGRVGIYAGLINHSGTIRADSAVAEGGRIMLKATKSVTLEESSVLSAQGRGGGRIEVLGGDSVEVAGVLDASAPNAGNGGFIETSGKSFSIDPSADITTAAPFGMTGTWLIDPLDFNIAPQGGNITGNALSALLINSSVVITSVDGLLPTPSGFPSGPGGVNGDILVNDIVDWTSVNSLTLTAIGNVNVNQRITNGGTGAINLFAGWDGADTQNPNVISCCSGSISLLAPISTAGTAVLAAGGQITQNASGVITASSLLAKSGFGGVALDGATNSVGTLAGVTPGVFHFKNDPSLIVGSVDSGNTAIGTVAGVQSTSSNEVAITVTAGNLTVNNDIRAVGSNSNDARITLTAKNNLVVNGSTISAQAAPGEGDGNAFVTLTAQTGGITVNNSTVEAISTGPGCCGTERDATLNMSAAAGSIILNTSTVTVTGGDGDSGTPGGVASATFLADKSIQLTGSNISVSGGDGGTGFAIGDNGGVATVTLTASSISLANSSSISAEGGAGGSGGNSGGAGGNGGAASVTLAGSSISVAGGSSVNATGGDGGSGGSGSGSGAAAGLGGRGGSATVNLSGNSISLVSSNVNADGGDAGDGGQADEGAAGGLGGDGGNARVTLAGGSVSLTGSGITVNGGQGGDGGSASFSSGVGGKGGNGGTATVTLTGSSISLAGGSSINASGGDGEDGGDNTFGGGVAGKGGNGGTATVTLTGSSISLSSSNIQAVGGSGGNGGDVSGSSGGIGANGGKGANASVMLNGGSITVNSAFVLARGGGSGSGGSGLSASGADGAGGAASVIATANAGNVTVQESTIRADGAEGGNSVINLVAPGNITVTGSTIQAGDTCCDLGTNGGASVIGLAAGGNITVDGGEGLMANGGDGQVNGGVAAITLAANGGITVSQASVQAFGGDGSAGNGGDAAVTFTANGGSILVKNTPFTIRAFGGEGPITGGSAAITMVAASGITIDGSTVNATAWPFNCDCDPSQNGGLGLVSLNANTGTINLLNGSVVEANGGGGTVNSGSGQINLAFSGRTSGGYFIDGVEGIIVDDLSLPTTGFFVNREPAILDTNLFATYLGNQPVFNDILVATMNQQADVLADQLRAGEVGEEEEKKKLPFCD